MKRAERNCIVCNKNYEYCSQGCKGAKANETWRNIYCSENCRSFFNICSSFAGKNITADEAKERLENIDIPTSLSDGLKKNLNDINTLSKPKGISIKPKISAPKPWKIITEQVKESEVVFSESDPEPENKIEFEEIKPKKRRGRPRKKKN